MKNEASNQPRDDKVSWIARVSQNGLELQKAPLVFKDDKAVVLAAVAQNGDALEYASEGSEMTEQ